MHSVCAKSISKCWLNLVVLHFLMFVTYDKAKLGLIVCFPLSMRYVAFVWFVTFNMWFILFFWHIGVIFGLWFSIHCHCHTSVAFVFFVAFTTSVNNSISITHGARGDYLAGFSIVFLFVHLSWHVITLSFSIGLLTASVYHVPVRMLFWTECEFCSNSPVTKSRTLSQTQIMKVCDTNHVAEFQDLCRGLSWFVSFVVDFVADFPHAL